MDVINSRSKNGQCFTTGLASRSRPRDTKMKIDFVGVKEITDQYWVPGFPLNPDTRSAVTIIAAGLLIEQARWFGGRGKITEN
jgi:hypothetical protein